MTGREVRIEGDGLAEESQRRLVLFCSILVKMPKAALIGFPSIEAVRRFAQYAVLFGLGKRRFDEPRNVRRNFVLYGKDVAEIAVVTFRPEVAARARVDQLRGDAHP